MYIVTFTAHQQRNMVRTPPLFWGWRRHWFGIRCCAAVGRNNRHAVAAKGGTTDTAAVGRNDQHAVAAQGGTTDTTDAYATRIGRFGAREKHGKDNSTKNSGYIPWTQSGSATQTRQLLLLAVDYS